MQDDKVAQDLEVEMKLELGELVYLAKSLDVNEEDVGTVSTESSGKSQAPSLSTEQCYGEPLSAEEAALAVPSGKDGLKRFALVVPDEFCVKGKLINGLNPRDFDIQKGTIKPRRASLLLTKTDLMSSLTTVVGNGGARYIFNGVLNGWPALRNFEIIGLDKKRILPGGVESKIMKSMGMTWVPHWRAGKGTPPEIKDNGIYRACLRFAPWTSIGWSPSSKGFVFWFEAQRSQGPRVVYGSDAITKLEDDICIAVHMISHRYATLHESPRDKLTYHSLVLLEWEKSSYCTIVEGAFLNGIGGYKGKCNWYDDKNEEVTELYKHLRPEMISPWLTTAAEIRCYDVKAKNFDEMTKYIEKYTGPDKRFLDPHYTFSHAARLTFRTRSNIAQYLVNYITRNSTYSEMNRNCQTFAADLCSFLAGKKDIVPYHPINRLDYYNKSHLFLYDSSMYKQRKGESLKGKIAR